MLRAIALALVLLASPASAELCPPPEPHVLRGLFVQSAAGPAFWLGEVGQNSAPGVGISFKTGFELWPFLALEALYFGALHETSAEAPPQPGAFQTHTLGAGFRLGIPIGVFDLYAHGAVGMSWLSSNVLVRIPGFDDRTRLAWLTGLGFTWHTPRKHFWFGLSSDVLGLLELPGVLIAASVHLGWTI